jgi:hypothetical protein
MAVVALISPRASTMPKTEFVPPKSKPITYGFIAGCPSIEIDIFVLKVIRNYGFREAKLGKKCDNAKFLG